MLASATMVQAREEPLWEAGAGITALSFPDYRGADHSRVYPIPTPYFVYRGEYIKADRYGLRGVLFNTDRLDLSMSAGASLPVRSSDVPAREGMPNLRPAVELGPSLIYTAWRTEDRRMRLDFRFPVRAGMTVESHPRFAGTQFFPHVNLDVHDPFGLTGWNLGVLTGPLYTDRRYNRYFYEVAPQYATPTRHAYSPDGGFAGVQSIAGVSKRYDKVWVGAFVRFDSLRGAKFEASPLVTSKHYLAGGIGISWMLGHSDKRVPVTDYGDDPR